MTCREAARAFLTIATWWAGVFALIGLPAMIVELVGVFV